MSVILKVSSTSSQSQAQSSHTRALYSRVTQRFHTTDQSHGTRPESIGTRFNEVISQRPCWPWEGNTCELLPPTPNTSPRSSDAAPQRSAQAPAGRATRLHTLSKWGRHPDSHTTLLLSQSVWLVIRSSRGLTLGHELHAFTRERLVSSKGKLCVPIRHESKVLQPWGLN